MQEVFSQELLHVHLGIVVAQIAERTSVRIVRQTEHERRLTLARVFLDEPGRELRILPRRLVERSIELDRVAVQPDLPAFFFDPFMFTLLSKIWSKD